ATAARSSRGHRLGRAGRDPGGLHPLELGHSLSGYRGAVAHAGRRTGDRRRLRYIIAGVRPRPGIVTDASDWADLVLVVSVALAPAAGGDLVCSACAGPYPVVRAGSGVDIRGAGRAHG